MTFLRHVTDLQQDLGKLFESDVQLLSTDLMMQLNSLSPFGLLENRLVKLLSALPSKPKLAEVFLDTYRCIKKLDETFIITKERFLPNVLHELEKFLQDPRFADQKTNLLEAIGKIIISDFTLDKEMQLSDAYVEALCSCLGDEKTALNIRNNMALVISLYSTKFLWQNQELRNKVSAALTAAIKHGDANTAKIVFVAFKNLTDKLPQKVTEEQMPLEDLLCAVAHYPYKDANMLREPSIYCL